MATDFSYNNTSIGATGGFKPTVRNTPLDVRTRVNTKADMDSIPNPYVGMKIIVLQDEDNNNKMTEYIVKSLKTNNLGVADSKINEVELVKDFLGITGEGTGSSNNYVTKETGNANQITFSDGQTFQAKLDDGTLKGDKGDTGATGANGQDGQTPNITIGTVTTLNAGVNATAEITGDTPNLTLNLGIPKGADGATGTGSDTDLSKLALNINNQTLSLKNDTSTLSSVTLPKVTVTDEQVSSAIQSKIDDGTLTSLSLGEGSVKHENIEQNAVWVSNCDFLDGIVNYENLHKKYTSGIGQSVGNVILGNPTAISSVVKVTPNKSYTITVTGDHDRFRISKYNIDGTEITSNIKGVKVIERDELSSYTIDDVGDYNTLVISVSNSSQTPTLEVYLNSESDVDFKFPVKADIVKDTAIINGASILDNTTNGECLINESVTPYKTTFLTEGKNKWKGDYFTGYAMIDKDNGAISNQNDDNYIIAYANIKGNTTYTVSYPNGNEKFRIFELNAEYDFTVDTPPISADKMIVNNDNLTEYTFTTSENAKMLLVYMSSIGQTYNLQIEEGDTKTDYRPYGFKLFDRYVEDITDINMVTQMFKEFIIDKDNAANKFYNCTELEHDKNISKYQHTDIYALYDALMEANPAYITSEVLGTTTYDGLEVRCYHFMPETLNITNFDSSTGTFNTTGTPRNISNRKRILCLSGTHGDERSPVLCLYTFLKDVCENPTNNALLNKIRRELEFIVIPVVNPTGYNALSRYAKNASGNNVEDLNRHFTDVLLTNDTYVGINNEAKIIADLMKANKDTLSAVIDFHNMQPQRGKNISWMIMDGEDLVKRANQAINKVSRKWQEKYSFLEQTKGFLFAETSNSDIVYPGNIITTIQRFGHQLGLNSMTLEFTTTLNYDGYNNAYSKEQLNLHLSLIGNLLSEYVD